MRPGGTSGRRPACVRAASERRPHAARPAPGYRERVEILGDDEAAALPAPPRRRPGPGDRAADGTVLDVTPDPDAVPLPDPDGDPYARRHGHADEHPGGHPGGHPEGAPRPVTRAQTALDALTGPESLGLSGLVVALVGATTSGLSPLVVVFAPQFLTGTGDGGRPIGETYALILAGFAVVALALGLGGLLRLRPGSPGWARAVTGAATVLAMLLLLVAAWGTWQSGGAGGSGGVEG